MGVFGRMMESLAAESAEPKAVMIDATYLKAHQGRHEHEAACSHRCQWSTAQLIHNRGQVSDYTGAAALLDDLPKAQWLLADRGYDADRSRDALLSMIVETGRAKWALTHSRCGHSPSCTDEARLEQINLGAAVHLPLDKFELG